MNTTETSRAAAPLVLILGLGETGVAAARWCARQGSPLRVADTRAQPGGLAALEAALADATVEYRLGCGEQFPPDLLDGVAQIVLSPGLVPHESPTRELLEQARARNVEVVGEIELFARALAGLAESREYRPRVLAITGTNGKTTVTALTRQLIEAGGMSARAAGNISPAALAALMDALDQDDLPQVWVLELSSFQLETTRTLAPDAAVVLNVTQDHLDWHGDMQAYAQAKARILKPARLAIVNRDDPLTLAMVESLQALNVRSFGRDVPALVGDMGLELGQGVAWLTACESNDFDEPAPAPRRKKDAPPPTRAGGRMSRLMPVDALRIRGVHNALNALAAMQLARSLDLGWGPMLRTLRDYAGEPHRAELVRSIGDVDYINDSKGTNVGATVAALEGLGQQVVLIAGGQGKGQDFSPLVPVVRRHARAVVLIGVDGAAIGKVLEPTGVPCVAAVDMREAVRRAAELAQPGDAVLLSPACASFDMFRNYPHRGEVFAAEVQELALDRGEVA
ncbi:UDP-N-acetylmuramoyl-L-alanine--D-glutamate ligase [Bordetella bronchiseptica]|uniref:UDP-N-acetylmuramoyl-L-alanine--D-glutamate ligase n=1 Tax=Bordetella bronchiseptica TaxID=518 RepID=UPI00045939CE|nr:UDP-N-acetylmuramoyl-L-alanine--D-glutamate ligase [Bordetella bronchiseptica]KAK52932.1 UDP-N-acetylmuramoyl-L-alanine--D-glutamate ligase [Bordetella bronchiseptica OSU054]KDB73115.1 UDP-N-acetylmuramoyl-L-alanine--D-glutamate ligase [Bordetella bronchiseptica CA90 BB1334]KDD41056.1 UDP-N-acetylmuramoyl-L-alanine--D-glutamate ligase [Bordetella bronchiseptica OSU095]QET70536.1 UDP-N-acetylmuramoyl-L-alanine--D-glutamate ligase [Bordetella bronchiseptica]